MDKKKVKVIIIILCLFLILLMCLLVLLSKKEEGIDPIITPEVVNKPVSIIDAIERKDSEYISQDKKTIYINFSKDLFDENGNSNEEYFDSLIDDIEPFLEEFTLIDEEKNIEIKVKNGEKTINQKENFYEEVDGKSYSNVDKAQIVKRTNMYIESAELDNITMDNMFLTDSVKEKLGAEDEIQLEENYTSYQNGKIKVSKYEYLNQIRNIIFTREYAQSVISGITANESIGEIYQKYSEPAFGSVREGYLGYRTSDVYVFFYNDEVSIYGYSYGHKSNLEKYLVEYVETKDLELFKNRMIVSFDNFYKYVYEKETESLYMLYPSLGIEIDIKNNNTTGIKLYQNCYLTDKTKELVKNGFVTFEEDIDLISKVEKERKGN